MPVPPPTLLSLQPTLQPAVWPPSSCEVDHDHLIEIPGNIVQTSSCPSVSRCATTSNSHCGALLGHGAISLGLHAPSTAAPLGHVATTLPVVAVPQRTQL